MRKKVIRVFYSWQDDIDSRLNRSFIKNCLDSTLAELNKKVEIDEAVRPQIELDHDTKGIPGIPDIANTILHKISVADIFITDLTFVAEYQNHKDTTKKVSNQNVMFEFGFAFNALGPGKIICLFNEAFGHPHDLPFDLQHRRWPIMFNLPSANASEKADQKIQLQRALRNAIEAILNSPSIKKAKLGLHSPFTQAQYDEFEYLLSKLDEKIRVHVKWRPKFSRLDFLQNSDWDGLQAAENSSWHEKSYSLDFLPVFADTLSRGKYSDLDLRHHIHKLLELGNILPNRDKYDVSWEQDKEFALTLRTLGLISADERFSQKSYKFLHWLEFTGYKPTTVALSETT